MSMADRGHWVCGPQLCGHQIPESTCRLDPAAPGWMIGTRHTGRPYVHSPARPQETVGGTSRQTKPKSRGRAGARFRSIDPRPPFQTIEQAPKGTPRAVAAAQTSGRLIGLDRDRCRAVGVSVWIPPSYYVTDPRASRGPECKSLTIAAGPNSCNPSLD